MHIKMEADSLQASPVFSRSFSSVQHLLVMCNVRGHRANNACKSVLGMQCAARAAAQEAEDLQQQEDALQQKIRRAEEQMAQAAQASTNLEETERVCCNETA